MRTRVMKMPLSSHSGYPSSCLSPWATMKVETAVTPLDPAPWLQLDAVPTPLSPMALCRRWPQMRCWTSTQHPALLHWGG